MARANEKIVHILRTTADRIVNSPNYQWGHMGSCNCGHLAQVITARTKAEIHQFAMMNEAGDWNDQLNDYCGVGNRPFDEIIAEMLDIGFDVDDLQHLERLSDRRILARLPEELKAAQLHHNVREDVSLYLTLWADMVADSIEEQDARMKKLAHQRLVKTVENEAVESVKTIAVKNKKRELVNI